MRKRASVPYLESTQTLLQSEPRLPITWPASQCGDRSLFSLSKNLTETDHVSKRSWILTTSSLSSSAQRVVVPSGSSCQLLTGLLITCYYLASQLSCYNLVSNLHVYIFLSGRFLASQIWKHEFLLYMIYNFMAFLIKMPIFKSQILRLLSIMHAVHTSSVVCFKLEINAVKVS